MKKIFFIMFFINFVFANELDFDILSSNFTQSVTSDKKTITYNGNFTITKNKAFWHYSTPTKKDIYITDGKVIIIEPELEQVIYTNLKDTPDLHSILGRAKFINNHYETNYDGIKYYIFTKNNMPYQIQYNDKIDNKVVLTFLNPKKDSSVQQSKFIPKIPKNYDIITQ